MGAEVFQRRVAETVERYGMDLSRPLALVSGGPDSTALLRVLAGLGARPAVLHVDHGMRGEESRGDAEFVRNLSGELGLECELREPELADGARFQEKARGTRYTLAEELAREIGASTIVTGHTADDVAETVLMNLARGSGIRGLTGIPPVRQEISRPLIEARRGEILDYLQCLGQTYRTDPTNALSKYSRNRVRNEALPVLESLYPNAGANMARAATLLRGDLDALERIAARAVRRHGDEMLVPSAGELDLALRRHAVRYAYSALAPAAPPLDSAAVESVLALSTGTLDLPSDVVAASRPGSEVALYERRKPPERTAVDIREGEVVLAGWSVRVREIPAPEGLPADAARPEVAYLDAASGPYRMRLVREGDVVRPVRLGGKKKVLRAMMDRKVPRDLRRHLPVIVDARERVAWVAGGELGEEFALGPHTRMVLRLEARGPA